MILEFTGTTGVGWCIMNLDHWKGKALLSR